MRMIQASSRLMFYWVIALNTMPLLVALRRRDFAVGGGVQQPDLYSHCTVMLVPE